MLCLVVGEYAGDHGFLLPNLFHTHPESGGLWSAEAWRVTIQKMNETWRGMLGDYDRGYDSARRVLNGQWQGRHAAQNCDEDGNLMVRYLYWNDRHWNWSNNWLSNDFDASNPAAVSASLFISPPAPAWGSFVW